MTLWPFLAQLCGSHDYPDITIVATLRERFITRYRACIRRRKHLVEQATYSHRQDGSHPTQERRSCPRLDPQLQPHW